MAQLIKTDGEVSELKLPKDETQLKILQDAVGGYIEIAHLKDGKCLVVNEDGLRLALKPNMKATELFGSLIVGNVVLAERKELR